MAEETRHHTLSQSIFEELSDQEITNEEIPYEPGVRIRNESEKQVVIWDYASCSVLLEDISDYSTAINTTMDFLDRINKVAPIEKLNQRKLRTYWILPISKYDFETLELIHRQNFMKPSSIFDNCIDSCVLLEMKHDNYVLHHQSGPMHIDELTGSYRAFEMKKGKYKLFIFLSASITDTNVVECSSEEMRHFLSWSLEKCTSHATDFEEIMEGIL